MEMKVKRSSEAEHVLWAAWFDGRAGKLRTQFTWTEWDRHWSNPLAYLATARSLAQAGYLHLVEYSPENDAACRECYRAMLLNTGARYDRHIPAARIDEMVTNRRFREGSFFMLLTFKGYVAYYKVRHSTPLWLRWRRFRTRYLYTPWQVTCPSCEGHGSYEPYEPNCWLCRGNETVYFWTGVCFKMRSVYWYLYDRTHGECKRCDGFGRLYDEDGDDCGSCPKCHGKGFVFRSIPGE